MESDWDFLRRYHWPSNGATPGDQVMGYTKHEMVYYGGPATKIDQNLLWWGEETSEETSN